MEDVPNSTEPESAAGALEFIRFGIPLDKEALGPEGFRAASILIQLTQIVESHDMRIGVADKWARASLKRISQDESTFRAEFNRTSGNFLPARADETKTKVLLSGHGGQIWARAATGTATENDPALSDDEVFTDPVLETLNYLSESSDEEFDNPPLPDLAVNDNIVRSTKKAPKRKKVDDDADWTPDQERKPKRRRLKKKQ